MTKEKNHHTGTKMREDAMFPKCATDFCTNFTFDPKLHLVNWTNFNKILSLNKHLIVFRNTLPSND